MIPTPFVQLIDFSPLVDWMPIHQRRSMRDLETGGATRLAVESTRQFMSVKGAELRAALDALDRLDQILAKIPIDLPHLEILLAHEERWISIEQLRELSAEELELVERWVFDRATKAANPAPEPPCLAALDPGAREEIVGRELLEEGVSR